MVSSTPPLLGSGPAIHALKTGNVGPKRLLLLFFGTVAIGLVIVNTTGFLKRTSQMNPLHFSDLNVHVAHRMHVSGESVKYQLPHEEGMSQDMMDVLERAKTELKDRSCGSPAIDGYAHVEPECLEKSPTAKWMMDYYRAGGQFYNLKVHIEKASDYDGLAVAWGIGNKKDTVEDCAHACLHHRIPQGGPFGKLPCNAFAWCGDPNGCFEPDAHEHTYKDCWLKFTEGPASPEVNMRGDLPDDYRKRHPNAPDRVQWDSGVLLPPGTDLTEGTMGPRWKW